MTIATKSENARLDSELGKQKGRAHLPKVHQRKRHKHRPAEAAQFLNIYRLKPDKKDKLSKSDDAAAVASGGCRRARASYVTITCKCNLANTILYSPGAVHQNDETLTASLLPPGKARRWVVPHREPCKTACRDLRRHCLCRR